MIICRVPIEDPIFDGVPEIEARRVARRGAERLRLDIEPIGKMYKLLDYRDREAFRRRGAVAPVFVITTSRDYNHLDGVFVGFRELDGRRSAERFLPVDMVAIDPYAIADELADWLARRWVPETWTNRIGRRDRLRKTASAPPPPPFRSRVHEPGKRRRPAYPNLAIPVVRWHENEVRPCR